MSILIKGMEMPKDCYDCLLMMSVFVFKGDSDMCSITLGGCTYDSRPPHCPLIELPPHGRLIDADALRDEWIWGTTDRLGYTKCIEVVDLDNAPTIIEAEGEE